MRSQFSILAVLAVAGLVAGHAAAADEAAALKARATAWEKAFNESKLEAVAAMYAQDGTRMPPNAAAVKGRDAILNHLRELKKMMTGVVIETSDAVIEGNLGITIGRYKIKGQDGAVIDEGKWISVGKKVNGEWTTVRDMWNSDRPLPAHVSQIMVREEEISDFAKGIVTPARSTSGGAGLLSAFFFKFLHDDHPLQTIAAHPLLGSTIEVAFADRDPSDDNDKYTYTIIYQHLNDPGIIEKSASLPICISHCNLFDAQLQDGESRGQFVFVLRGFKFTYARDDFAIKKFGIIESNGNIDVELHDRGGLNQFAVTVDYALVPSALISSSALVEGESSGATRHPIPAGTATLSGFSFEYIDDDFKMQELGALARQPVSPGPNVEVYFNDRSQNSHIRYKVAYNIMSVN